MYTIAKLGVPGLAHAVDRVLEGLRVKARAAPARIDDFRPFATREVNAPDRVGDETVPGGVSRFARHDLHLPTHPHYADPIIAHRADSAADGSAMAVIGLLTASGRKMSSETAFKSG
jgi:hypothetical protein